jgi:hypothetical protein
VFLCVSVLFVVVGWGFWGWIVWACVRVRVRACVHVRVRVFVRERKEECACLHGVRYGCALSFARQPLLARAHPFVCSPLYLALSRARACACSPLLARVLSFGCRYYGINSRPHMPIILGLVWVYIRSLFTLLHLWVQVLRLPSLPLERTLGV